MSLAGTRGEEVRLPAGTSIVKVEIQGQVNDPNGKEKDYTVQGFRIYTKQLDPKVKE